MTFINAATNPLASNVGAINQSGTGGAFDPAEKSLSLSRFETALARANTNVQSATNTFALQPPTATPGVAANQPVTGVQVAQANDPSNAVNRTSATSVTTDTVQADRTRALRGLDLSKDANNVDENKTGENIIDGLKKLRGVFDSQEEAITSISGQPLTNSTALINLQLEVVKYSMLMDVTSKLTGKSTQAFDTLMKGQ